MLQLENRTSQTIFFFAIYQNTVRFLQLLDSLETYFD